MKTTLLDDIDERLVEQMMINHLNRKLITPKEVTSDFLFLANAGNRIILSEFGYKEVNIK